MEKEKAVADTQGGSGARSPTPALYRGRRKRRPITLQQLDASHWLDEVILRNESVYLGCIVKASDGTR
jgi:hypothetical protein